jgi:hypothetical protein
MSAKRALLRLVALDADSDRPAGRTTIHLESEGERVRLVLRAMAGWRMVQPHRLRSIREYIFVIRDR